MSVVRLGYFEKFGGNDTLLIDGDEEGLLEIARQLQGLILRRVEVLAIHLVPFVEAHRGVQLVASCSTTDHGVRKSGATEFNWQQTTMGWEDAVEKVTVIGRCRQGHHYIEEETSKVILMVSKGEYGSDFWTAHG